MFASPTKSKNLAFESFIPPFLDQWNTALCILTVISGVGRKKVCNCVARTAPFTYIPENDSQPDRKSKQNKWRSPSSRQNYAYLQEISWHCYWANVTRYNGHLWIWDVWMNTISVPVVLWNPLEYLSQCVCIVQIRRILINKGVCIYHMTSMTFIFKYWMCIFKYFNCNAFLFVCASQTIIYIDTNVFVV